MFCKRVDARRRFPAEDRCGLLPMHPWRGEYGRLCYPTALDAMYYSLFLGRFGRSADPLAGGLRPAPHLLTTARAKKSKFKVAVKARLDWQSTSFIPDKATACKQAIRDLSTQPGSAHHTSRQGKASQVALLASSTRVHLQEAAGTGTTAILVWPLNPVVPSDCHASSSSFSTQSSRAQPKARSHSRADRHFRSAIECIRCWKRRHTCHCRHDTPSAFSSTRHFAPFRYVTRPA